MPKLIQCAELQGVEVFATGEWAGHTFTEHDLDEMVANFGRLVPAHVQVPVKLGHADQQVIAQRNGQPALGWVSRLYRSGKKLLADFTAVPATLLELIRAQRYRFVSAELYRKWQDTHYEKNLATGATGHVLTAVAFLGADLPEVKSLAELGAVLADDAAGGAGKVVVTAAPTPEGMLAVPCVPAMDAAARAIHASSTDDTTVPETTESPMPEPIKPDPTAVPPPAPKAPEPPADETPAIKLAMAELAAKLDASEARNAKLAEEHAAMREREKLAEARALHADAERTVAKFSTPECLKIVTPAQREIAMLILTRATAGVAVTAAEAGERKLFAADEKPRDLSVRELFDRYIAATPEAKHLLTEMTKDTPAPAAETFTSAVEQIIARDKLDPVKDYGQAVTLARKERPDLYGYGGYNSQARN